MIRVLILLIVGSTSVFSLQTPTPSPTPLNRSFIAFTIPEKDLLPENVAFDPVEEAFYVGSTRKGKIVKVDRQKRVTDFTAPRQDGLWQVIGMKVDSVRRILWVCSSMGDNLIGFSRSETSPAGVFKYDLRTGKLIKKYVLDTVGEQHFFNDLTLTELGDVFVSHMAKDSLIYRIERDSDRLELFLKPEGIPEPNGITISKDNKTLYVAHDTGAAAIDITTKTITQISAPQDVSLRGIDGLYFYENSLIAVHPGKKEVRRYFLDQAGRAVRRADTLESNHPMMNIPTTGVVVQNRFYYVANSQFASFNRDGTLFPMERLFEPVILQVDLEPETPSFSVSRSNLENRLETVAAGLEIPWSIDFAPDGRIFVTERPGRIRVVQHGKLLPEKWAELKVAFPRGEGLMGLAVSPNFRNDKEIFVLGTFLDRHRNLISRIVRFREENGRGIDPQTIVDNLPASRIHSGGELSFGPDGMLYAAIGDIEKLDLVQDKSSAVGKILRYRRDGSIPQDNPFPNSPVFAIGVRNSQGFDWHPESKEMFAVEHGPSGFPEENNREDKDEMNVILKGENYGWPIASGIGGDTRFVNPLVDWSPAIAPGNIAVVKDNKSRFFCQFFVAGLRGQQLRRVKVAKANNRAGWKIVEEEPLFYKRFGRIRAVAFSPDGYLYFANSNLDEGGRELKLFTADDDRLFRLKVT